MSVIGIIPARFASSRFPGKPLADILGKSMLQRVFEQATRSKILNEIIIATDDQKISDHAKSFGANVVMTSVDHPSGTDRCYEAYSLYGKTFDYVINIQGDEPFLDPEQIDSLAAAFTDKAEIITQIKKCTSHEVLFDTGEVKIVLNEKKEALYFSRSVMPFLKNADPKEWHKLFDYYRHVGLYAYRSDILKKLCALQPSALEKAESLEQLRWLENGYRIKCVETTFDSHCIDTKEDIAKVLRLMNIS